MTAPKRTCSTHMCTEQAGTWMMTWRDGFDEWCELPYCDEHYFDVKEETARRRVAAFTANNWKMHGWDITTFPADDPAGSAAKAAAMDWFEGSDTATNLFIHGGVGTGKSGLVWSLARRKVESDLFNDTQFVNVRQLLARIRRSFGNPEAKDPIDELIDCYWLVLDDLGAERVTDWTREWLATLIEGRYINEYPTIVTSNYSPSQLARRLGHDDPIVGKRIVSRLVESAEIIKLDRADLRLRKEAA